MSGIWFLSKKYNSHITGFNKVIKEGISELWVTESSGSSRKVATGKKADELENYLLTLLWGSFPCVILDEKGNIGGNIEIEE